MLSENMLALWLAPDVLVSYASYGLLALSTVLLGAWAVMGWLEGRVERVARQRNIRYVRTPIQVLSVMRRKRYELVEKRLVDQHGCTYACCHLGGFTVVTSNPELVQLVCNREFTNFTNRRFFELADPVFQGMLFATRDDTWKRLRSIMTPAFSTGKLRKVKYCIDNTASTLLNNFEKALRKSEIVNLKQYVGAFTMDTIIQMAFGVQIDSLAEKDSPIITHARGFFSNHQSLRNTLSFAIATVAPNIAYKLGLRVFAKSMDFFKDIAMGIVAKKRAEIESRTVSSGKASNFIELLLEAEQEAQQSGDFGKDKDRKSNKFITNTEILANSVLFFMAGYDTTATTISNTLYYLATHPEVEDKLHGEINKILEQLAQESGQTTDPFELVTLDTLPRFKYLTACINETLRLHPPGTAVERTATEDMHLETTDGKVKIDLKKGDVVRIPIYSLHHNPNNFAEPELFKPERFLDGPTYHKFAFIPFGTGPRNCIARSLAYLEAQVALLHLIRKFRFTTCEQTKTPLDFYVLTDTSITKDIYLKVERW